VDPGPFKVKVVVLIEEGFIASLKVAVTTVLGQTPGVPLGGVSEITVGGAHNAPLVVKVHPKLLANALPNVSVAPVVIAAVYKVFSARALDGVKVAVKPE
jgi:hypothetical protein